MTFKAGHMDNVLTFPTSSEHVLTVCFTHVRFRSSWRSTESKSEEEVCFECCHIRNHGDEPEKETGTEKTLLKVCTDMTWLHQRALLGIQEHCIVNIHCTALSPFSMAPSWCDRLYIQDMAVMLPFTDCCVGVKLRVSWSNVAVLWRLEWREQRRTTHEERQGKWRRGRKRRGSDGEELMKKAKLMDGWY